jgi:hypothetical protein
LEINVVPKVINAVAEAGLSQQVPDNLGGQLRKDQFNGVIVTDIPFCKGKTQDNKKMSLRRHTLKGTHHNRP